jgi:dienelactone hydrolase
MVTTINLNPVDRVVKIPLGEAAMEGNLVVPEGAQGVVIFAHGSGSSRHSPRNRFVAEQLRRGGLGTLLVDLLTPQEEAIDERTAYLRFDIGLLADRLAATIDWLGQRAETTHFLVGLFGASTGGGAALVAAARAPQRVAAVVSRGGRPDLAGEALSQVNAPTLLIVGGDDPLVIQLNRQAVRQLRCEKELRLIPGANHLFEEPGTLAQVADLAREWFQRHLTPAVRQ